MKRRLKFVLLSEAKRTPCCCDYIAKSPICDPEAELGKRNSGSAIRLRKDIVNNVNGEWASGYWGVGGYGGL